MIAPPPGTLITVTASKAIVVMRDAPWGVVFASRFDALLNGCLVRQVIDGVVNTGVQTTDGGLFPLDGETEASGDEIGYSVGL